MKVTLNLTEEQLNEIKSEKEKTYKRKIEDLQGLRVYEHNELIKLMNSSQKFTYKKEYFCVNCRYCNNCNIKKTLPSNCRWKLVNGKIEWEELCKDFKED